MELEFQKILEKSRDLSFDKGIRKASMDDIANVIGMSKKTLFKYIKNKTDLVQKVLDFERDSFGKIFDEYNFEGVNAIDILLTVSREISRRFKYVNPMVTYELRKYYPAIYRLHFEKRIDFIFEKIKINIEKGISQGVYRSDFSIELLARLYISRLIDLQNPVFFPPDKFSFGVLFEVMFDNFIRGIANTQGMAYYEERRKDMVFK
jgi:AcrR family transcriptional regulator